MSQSVLLLGRMQSPFEALVLHINTLDPMAIHLFLRNLRKQGEACNQVVLMADEPEANPHQLRVLAKAIALSQFSLVAVAGPGGANWGSVMGVGMIDSQRDKPKVVLFPEAVKMRSAFLQSKVSKPKTEAPQVNTKAAAVISTDEVDQLRRMVEHSLARVDRLREEQESKKIEQPAASPDPGEPTVHEDRATPTILEEASFLEEAPLQVSVETVEKKPAVFQDAHTQVIESMVAEFTAQKSDHAVSSDVAPSALELNLIDDQLISAIPVVITNDAEIQVEAIDVVEQEVETTEDMTEEPMSLSIESDVAPVEENLDLTSWELLPIEEKQPIARHYKDPFEEMEINSIPEVIEDALAKAQNWEKNGSVAVMGQNEPATVRDLAHQEPKMVVIETIAPLRHPGRLRSGQLIMHAGDVIVENSVNSGAEIVATGDIHVYGSAGGRLLAGAQGNKHARIYIQSFDAELVAIAGRYHLFEEVPAGWVGKPLKISLINDELHFEPIVAMPKISSPQAA